VRIPPCPKHLAEDGRRLWTAVLKRYAFNGPQLVLVSELCACCDRIAQARAAIAADGAFSRGSIARAHPAHRVEKDNRAAMANLWRVLGLDLADAPQEAK
jgi:hypothetical protein